jgi:hypothetical protein
MDEHEDLNDNFIGALVPDKKYFSQNYIYLFT